MVFLERSGHSCIGFGAVFWTPSHRFWAWKTFQTIVCRIDLLRTPWSWISSPRSHYFVDAVRENGAEMDFSHSPCHNTYINLTFGHNRFSPNRFSSSAKFSRKIFKILNFQKIKIFEIQNLGFSEKIWNLGFSGKKWKSEKFRDFFRPYFFSESWKIFGVYLRCKISSSFDSWCF